MLKGFAYKSGVTSFRDPRHGFLSVSFGLWICRSSLWTNFFLVIWELGGLPETPPL